ncbi:DMT family transporter [Brevibacillus sp. NPDC058079]|uniref:DMT family transporter n=1 Tax=Brevibacillus sp. NPDC058079 TaxID=3346330 RepID=UPI0036EAC962
MNGNWVYILVAGFFEVLWVIGLKHSSNGWMWLGTIVAIFLSFDFLIRASKQLPLGTAYAVFTGIGTMGTVVIEILIFGEPFKWIKLLLILILLAGIVGLKVITKDMDTKGEAA